VAPVLRAIQRLYRRLRVEAPGVDRARIISQICNFSCVIRVRRLRCLCYHVSLRSDEPARSHFAVSRFEGEAAAVFCPLTCDIEMEKLAVGVFELRDHVPT